MFADKHQLPFPLLSDVDGKIAERYGALWSLGPIRIARRHSFLIDRAGNITQIYRSVDPDSHYRQVLDDLAKATDNQR
jgi:peroxiredoxin Q/BCP